MNVNNDVKIENLSNCLRSVKLNSGIVLHIPPRSISETLAGVEAQNNAEIDKLLNQCAIAVHQAVECQAVERQTNAPSESDSTSQVIANTPVKK